MRPQQIKQENITRFCGKQICAKCKKKHISIYPANTRRCPALGKRWASFVDGGPAPTQHRDNVLCLLGIHDILLISKKLNKVMINSQQY